MRRRRSQVAAFVAAVMLAAPAAHAFTIEDGGDKSGQQKFDLEEQSRNFRTPRVDLSTPGANSYETPFGKMQFGVQSNSFGYGAAARDRDHVNRMFAPDFLKDR